VQGERIASTAPSRVFTVAGLRCRLRPTGQNCLGGGVGVDRVGLALGRPGIAVGTVDLDGLHALGMQVAGQPSAVGAGALHADLYEAAMAA
jgi:hypothetical protein